MTSLHYWSLKHTITGWGVLIVATQLDSPWLFMPMIIASIGSFACDYHCMKKIKKETT